MRFLPTLPIVANLLAGIAFFLPGLAIAAGCTSEETRLGCQTRVWQRCHHDCIQVITCQCGPTLLQCRSEGAGTGYFLELKKAVNDEWNAKVYETDYLGMPLLGETPATLLERGTLRIFRSPADSTVLLHLTVRAGTGPLVQQQKVEGSFEYIDASGNPAQDKTLACVWK